MPILMQRYFARFMTVEKVDLSKGKKKIIIINQLCLTRVTPNSLGLTNLWPSAMTIQKLGVTMHFQI